jgi:hypothetical protein
VRLDAYDVDNIQMRFTRADLLLSFGNRTIPFQWSRGSNEYIADVRAAQLGVYGLVVIANNAWNGSASWASRCELLQTSISVHELLLDKQTTDTSATWILVGAGSAAVVLVGGLVVVVRKRHAHLQAIMAMLFSEVPPFDEPHAHVVCSLTPARLRATRHPWSTLTCSRVVDLLEGRLRRLVLRIVLFQILVVTHCVER